MGQIQIISREQKIILDGIRDNDFLKKNFYFTGGTALNAVYLHHRCSEDLDFFTYDIEDFREVADFVKLLTKTYHFTYTSQTLGFANFYKLKFKKVTVKVDFSKYPYKQLEKTSEFRGLKVDSLLDIAVNKLSLLSHRIEVKDYVDLYFLLKKFSLWDLIEGVKIKFNMEIEPFILAADFTKVEDFETLPKMIKPLNLPQLKKFFRQEAQKLGARAIK